MKNSIFIALLLALCASACDWSGGLTLEQWSNIINPPDTIPPDTIVVPPPPDTCEEYFPIDTPSFIQAYGEFDMPISASGWIIHAGTFFDTIFPGEEDEFPEKLKAVMQGYEPQYIHYTNYNPDARRLNLIIRGTDDHTFHQLKVWVRTQYAKVYLGFNKRAFSFGGAVTYEEQLEYADIFPSVKLFNIRDFPNPDSIKERKCCLAILGHCKKAPNGSRADFRFNYFEPGDSLIQAFDEASWDEIWHNFNPGEPLYLRGAWVGMIRSPWVVDMRGHVVTDDDIIQVLNEGYQVLADLD